MGTLRVFALIILIFSILLAQRPEGNSLNLDGDGDFMQLSYYADSLIFAAPVTIEFWLRADFDHWFDLGLIWTLNDGNDIATNGAESFELRYGNHSSGLTNERLSIFYSLGTLANTNVFGTQDNLDYKYGWHHYAMVADSFSYHVYIDGMDQTLYANSSSGNGIAKDYGASVSPKVNVALGARYLNNTPSYDFNGRIDEFRIWNVVRDSSQIVSTMNDTLGPEYYSTADSGLVGYWRFDEMEDLGVNGDGADDVRDYSIHGYHGDLVGDAVVDMESFTDTNAPLEDVSNGAVSWGDYDNDDDLDILITGQPPVGNTGLSKIYRNDNGSFIDINAPLESIYDGSVTWGDYDNDDHLDILLTGQSSQGRISKIYRNSMGFIDINAALEGVSQSSVAWGDYNNDGALDILLAGNGQSFGYVTKIYRNQVSIGAGFADINAPLTGVALASVAWGDYDNDGDLDVLSSGYDINSQPSSRIYRNDNGAFIDINAPLVQAEYGSVAWGDYDMDGDLDILLIGAADTQFITKIYRNDDTTFTDINAPLVGAASGSVAWGDFDNDGDLDVLLTSVGTPVHFSKIYRNDDSTFTDIDAPLQGAWGPSGSVAVGDYDSDGDLDVLLTGQTNGPFISRVYQNNNSNPNVPPTSPGNLSASTTDTTASLSWSAASDPETPSPGLTYNLRIGTTPGGSDVMGAMAGSNGYRRVAQMGNVNQNLSWTIRNLLPNTTYYWSVQAVDNCFAGGSWAAEETFTTGPTGVSDEPSEIPVQYSLDQNYPNPFNPTTTIRFGLPKAAHVRIELFNIKGQRVAVLLNERKEAGYHVVDFNGSKFASGVYFYHLQTEGYVNVKKMVLIR